MSDRIQPCNADETDECPDDCAACGSGEWELMCSDCRFYAAQDAEPIAEVSS
jgi:hypothetical protein